jgi:hypothetical protein
MYLTRYYLKAQAPLEIIRVLAPLYIKAFWLEWRFNTDEVYL